MDISGKLAQANGRLRAARIGVAIEERGDRLCLRATFPPKPGSKKLDPHQQRLTTGFRANPAGLKLAEQEARIVGTLLEQGNFDWALYLKGEKSPSPVTAGEWLEKLHAHYLNQGGSEGTWQGDYWKILKKLPADELLTVEGLQTLVNGTTPNTRTRQRACMAVGVLAKFAGLNYDPSSYRGDYSPSAVDPRDIPNDQLIVECREKLANPSWRWVYSMMAAYGLRNHEVFRLDLEQLRSRNDVVTVLAQTKTGARKVWCFYPEWFHEWKLYEVSLPGIDMDRPNDAVGHSVTEYFSDIGLPFSPYNLRHAWAIRTLVLGLPHELAAKQQGHSLQVHERTYQRWIKSDVHQFAYEAIKNRSDRPTPPPSLQLPSHIQGGDSGR